LSKTCESINVQLASVEQQLQQQRHRRQHKASQEAAQSITLQLLQMWHLRCLFCMPRAMSFAVMLRLVVVLLSCQRSM
jgi:hypothetical protein